MNLSETYFLKALDNYPYNIESAIENLNYSLSYDDNYAPALCLMAKIYMNEIKDYARAEEYFNKALAADFEYSETHICYPKLLFKLNKMEELQKLLKHSFKVAGIDKAKLYHIQGLAFEYQGKLVEAVDIFHKALSYAFNTEADQYLSEEIKRVEGKLKKIRKKKAEKPKIKSHWVKTYSF